MSRKLGATLAAVVVALAGLSFSRSETTDAKVTYVTSATVYVAAGRDEGLREGDVVELVREGQAVATLEVTYLSSHLAACTVTQSSVTPEVGDLVRFRPAASPAPSGVEAGVASAPRSETRKKPENRARDVGIRGRVGVRYLWVKDRSAGGNQFSQPALDLKLDGNRVGGGPMDFAVDVRARRTSQTFTDGTHQGGNENRVYRASASWNAKGSGLRMSIGRQYSPSLATISIFDGVAVEFGGARVSAGTMSGTQPDPVTFGRSSAIREHGAYFQLHNRPQEKKFWSWTTGFVGSYDGGEINREFLYLQGQYVGKRVSGYLAQEVDYNRGWKADMGESTISPTSTFGHLLLRANEHLDVYGGFDNRRSVRLWRDRITPETEFDDSYRQGAWLGASTRFAGRYGVGIDARSSGGGSAGSTDSYGLRFQAERISRLNLDVRTRSTEYTGDLVEGWLHSVSVGLTPMQRVHFELTGGVREETHPHDPLLDGRLSWVGLDLDVGLGRHWYLLVSGESDRGDLASTDQYYVSVTYRF